jgi:hypothetical protein
VPAVRDETYPQREDEDDGYDDGTAMTTTVVPGPGKGGNTRASLSNDSPSR